MKNYLLSIFFLITFLIFFGKELKSEDPAVYIEIPGSRIEFCVGDKIVLTGKCIYNTNDFVRHDWEASIEETIIKKHDRHVFLEFGKAGEHRITYYAWNDQNQKASESVVLKVYDLPESKINKSKKFFDRLFGRELPIILEAEYVDTSYSYQWYQDNEVIEDATEPKFEVTERGSYRLVITTEYGCKAYSELINIK